ncbi:Hypothetical protein zj316_2p47 (plasmid) [Lactiplantibacillus plantarum ZJ316]|nr:Hypothetical protein zj316_2p47 [Lactiplantibacillus plantarum ZJ316]
MSMAKGKVKKLASNLGMFAIGNLGSKLISYQKVNEKS